MTNKQIRHVACAVAITLPVILSAAARGHAPILTPASSVNTVGASIQTSPVAETALTATAKLALLTQKVKYLFVLFQENRAFDHYFGTYPGANGLLNTYAGANVHDASALPASTTKSFDQLIRNIDGSYAAIHPFLAPRTVEATGGEKRAVPLYPEDFYSVDHSHSGMLASMHFDTETETTSLNDAYALDNEGYAYLTDASGGAGIVVAKGTSSAPTSLPKLVNKQAGEAALAHLDCDTVPFLWQWADRFTLFDNFHQTIIGPSTPNAIAMIAAQSGATQWALHPEVTGKNAGEGAPYAVPNEADTAPFPGSAADAAAHTPPFGPDEQSFAHCITNHSGASDLGTCKAPTTPANLGPLTTAKLKGTPGAYAAPQIPLTFASLPLSFMGPAAQAITAGDEHPATDLLDVQKDIQAIAKSNPSVNWGWYQQGYGPEPFDATATVYLSPLGTPHPSYIVHHNGPQYFGYVGDNPAELAHMHGLQQFYTDIAHGALPAAGGVFYVRGGYFNNDNLVSTDPSPNVRATFAGNDDHGAYADSQISEAMLADSINAIAHSRYWSQSAIIITYDETDGFYDHVPSAIRNWGPDGLPMSGGPRVPTLVLSPYSASHTVSHRYSEHGSVVRFINLLFGLTALSDLPDERHAQALGATNAALRGPNGPQTQLAPNDGPAVGDLFEAFDNDKLLGKTPPIPASYAMIPPAAVTALPHYGGQGCSTLNITPTDYPNGYGTGLESDPPPADFNPRPTVSVGVLPGNQVPGVSYPANIPASGDWAP